MKNYRTNFGLWVAIVTSLGGCGNVPQANKASSATPVTNQPVEIVALSEVGHPFQDESKVIKQTPANVVVSKEYFYNPNDNTVEVIAQPEATFQLSANIVASATFPAPIADVFMGGAPYLTKVNTAYYNPKWTLTHAIVERNGQAIEHKLGGSKGLVVSFALNPREELTVSWVAGPVLSDNKCIFPADMRSIRGTDRSQRIYFEGAFFSYFLQREYHQKDGAGQILVHQSASEGSFRNGLFFKQDSPKEKLHLELTNIENINACSQIILK